MTFWFGCRSGSSDPYLWLTDLAPEPTVLSVPFKTPTKNIFVLQVYMLIPFWKYIYIIKVRKKSQNSRNQGFFSLFRLFNERSGSGSVQINDRSRSRRIRTINNGPDPGGPKTYWSYGSGSGTLIYPQNITLEDQNTYLYSNLLDLYKNLYEE